MRILLSQRQSRDKHGTTLDCLEEHYVNYFAGRGFDPIPMPNKPELVESFMNMANGVVLTGGGNVDPRLFGQTLPPGFDV